MSVKIELADIFSIECDAIVNPAHYTLMAGGGLCGVIHKLAGQELENACVSFGEQQEGNAVTTPSFNLENCKYVIHACGPRWLFGDNNEEEKLKNTYENIFQQAEKYNIKSLAIPAISTGIYGFPTELAGKIAIQECLQHKDYNICLVHSEQDKAEIYKNILEEK